MEIKQSYIITFKNMGFDRTRYGYLVYARSTSEALLKFREIYPNAVVINIELD